MATRIALSQVCRALRGQAHSFLPAASCGLQENSMQTTIRALWLASAQQECCSSSQPAGLSSLPAASQQLWHRSVTSFAAAEAQLEAPTPPEDLVITDSAVQRLQELMRRAGESSDAALRIAVDSGGCSGFQYKFDLDNKIGPDDRIFEQSGVRVVADSVSMEFLRGSVIDFTTDLIRSGFEVTENPNAKGGCGCGASFEPR